VSKQSARKNDCNIEITGRTTYCVSHEAKHIVIVRCVKIYYLSCRRQLL